MAGIATRQAGPTTFPASTKEQMMIEMSDTQPVPIEPHPEQVPYTRTNGLATAALVIGLLNCTVGLCLFGVLGLISIGLGLGALLSMRPGERGTGMAWSGIALGVAPVLALVVLTVLGVGLPGPY
jgi:hypothetical protein